jgi:hypothetical protein
MADWVDPRQPHGGHKSLFRAQYNALGRHNLAAIERIVTSKYRRGPTFNRQHPFVDVLLADITDSGETLDLSKLVREPPLSNGCNRGPHRAMRDRPTHGRSFRPGIRTIAASAASIQFRSPSYATSVKPFPCDRPLRGHGHVMT